MLSTSLIFCCFLCTGFHFSSFQTRRVTCEPFCCQWRAQGEGGGSISNPNLSFPPPLFSFLSRLFLPESSSPLLTPSSDSSSFYPPSFLSLSLSFTLLLLLYHFRVAQFFLSFFSLSPLFISFTWCAHLNLFSTLSLPPPPQYFFLTLPWRTF